MLIGIGVTIMAILGATALGWLLSWTLDKSWAGKFWATVYTLLLIIGIVLIGVGFATQGN